MLVFFERVDVGACRVVRLGALISVGWLGRARGLVGFAGQKCFWSCCCDVVAEVLKVEIVFFNCFGLNLYGFRSYI